MIPENLEPSLRAFVAQGAGLASGLVIPGNDKGPRPKDPYASVLRVGSKRTGYPIRRHLANGMVASLQYKKAQYSVQFYRAGALDLAEAFADWAESENGLTAAEAADPEFRVQFPFEVKRIDGEVSQEFEERAWIDLTIEYAHNAVQDAGYYTSANVDLCVEPLDEEAITHAGN